jgi:1-acyl-sn-glycerol-3-phosphate acyltransferase
MLTSLAKLRMVFWTGPMIILATAVMGSISLFLSLFDSSGNTQHRVARAWSHILLWIARVRVEVEGQEKIAPGGSYVFVANHRSFYDVPCILPNIAVQFRFLADKPVFSVPFIGYHLKRAGHLPVNEDSARESLATMSEAARIIHERGISILLFPEGERTTGDLLPFKDGAAYIAIKAGVPIVPISLVGAGDILPRGSLLVRGGVVHMRIGDPMPTLDLSLQDRTRLSLSLRETIEKGAKSAEATAVTL